MLPLERKAGITPTHRVNQQIREIHSKSLGVQMSGTTFATASGQVHIPKRSRMANVSHPFKVTLAGASASVRGGTMGLPVPGTDLELPAEAEQVYIVAKLGLQSEGNPPEITGVVLEALAEAPAGGFLRADGTTVYVCLATIQAGIVSQTWSRDCGALAKAGDVLFLL